MTIGRLARAAALAIGVLVVLPMGAQAHVNSFEVKHEGFINGDGVDVFGRISCTAGEHFVVRERVTQKNPEGVETFRGVGVDKGTCTGGTQRWHVLTDDNTGVPQEGDATATGRAFTEVQGTLHGPVVKDQRLIFLFAQAS